MVCYVQLVELRDAALSDDLIARRCVLFAPHEQTFNFDSSKCLPPGACLWLLPS